MLFFSMNRIVRESNSLLLTPFEKDRRTGSEPTGFVIVTKRTIFLLGNFLQKIQTPNTLIF